MAIVGDWAQPTVSCPGCGGPNRTLGVAPRSPGGLTTAAQSGRGHRVSCPQLSFHPGPRASSSAVALNLRDNPSVGSLRATEFSHRFRATADGGRATARPANENGNGWFPTLCSSRPRWPITRWVRRPSARTPGNGGLRPDPETQVW